MGEADLGSPTGQGGGDEDPGIDTGAPSGGGANPGPGGAGGTATGGPGSGGEAGSSGGDAGSSGVGGSAGAGGSEQAMRIPGVEITLKSGEKKQGQLIAQYDHSIWWVNPSPEKTYALFEPAKFAEYPDDASSQFLSSYDIASMKDITLPPGTVLYRDMVRDKGMLVAKMPVAGPLFVGTGNGGLHLEEMGQSDFAWDLVRANPNGTSYTGNGKSNADYLIWDAPIVLPVGGYVVEVERDAPDNVPGQTDISSPSNVVTVHLGGQFYLYFLHMRKGTIPASVQVGATLPAGTTIGHVGNSGASIEPHLHMGMLWYDGVTKRVWSVPLEWTDVWSSSSSTGPATHHDYHVPEVGTWISGSKF